MFLVVTYDILDDDRRLKVSQLLENLGERVQRSVFECYLTPEQVEGLKERIARIIKISEDNVRYYRLCESCRSKAAVLGPVPLTEDPGYYLI